MKCQCKIQHKQLEGILDKGDIVEIEDIRTNEDTILSYKWVEDENGTNKINGKKVSKAPYTIQPAGSYIDYHFKSKNGEYYSGRCISGIIGPRPMSEIFDKL
jgi:signal peptidase I